jgi:Polyketide cyclase / dehydrase and lipid transport
MVLSRSPPTLVKVFGFLSDFENLPRWNYAIVETHKVSQGPVGVGTIYDPPRQLEIRGQLGPFPSRLSYALDAIPEGTRVTNTVELQLRGPGRLLGPLAVPGVRDAVATNLHKLKELLER